MTIELLVVGLFGALWLLVVINAIIGFQRRTRVLVVPPQKLSVKQIERADENMADTMTYEIAVGGPATQDVVSRELTVVVDGVYRDPVVFPAYEVSFGRISVPQDSEVVVSLVDVDDAGNRSEPSTVSFKAIDVVPPAAPGGLNVTVVGETHESAVVDVVTPEVAPETTPESVDGESQS